MNTRTPKSTRPHSRSSDEAVRERGRDADELALAALSAPFPPEPAPLESAPSEPLAEGAAERGRERPPPRDGVEPEDADDFSGEAPTTVRAPASGIVARSPALAALLAAHAPVAPPSERALARVALIIMAAGPGELLVPLPPFPHGPSMLLLIGLSVAPGRPSGLAARLGPAASVAAAGELFALSPVDSVDSIEIAPELAELAENSGAGRAPLDSAPSPGVQPSEAASTPVAGFSSDPAAPHSPRAPRDPAGAGCSQTPVALGRETLPPPRRRRSLAVGAAALVLVGATGMLARAGLLDGLHGFDAASSAAIALEQRAQRALSRPVASMLPSVMPAEPATPEPTTDDLVERAKRLINAGGAPRLREAQTLLEQAKASDAQNPHVRATLGELLLQRGVHEAAFTEAAEAVHLRPRRARYRVLLGDVYRALGRADEAEKAYTKAAELDPHGRSVDDVDGASVRALSEL